MNKHYLTYDELMELARKNYTKGGMTTYECLGRKEFDEIGHYNRLTEKEALEMFHVDYGIEQECIAMSNWDLIY